MCLFLSMSLSRVLSTAAIRGAFAIAAVEVLLVYKRFLQEEGTNGLKQFALYLKNLHVNVPEVLVPVLFIDLASCQKFLIRGHPAQPMDKSALVALSCDWNAALAVMTL